MKAGWDTSVVPRLLLGQPADQAARAVAFLDELARAGHQAVVADLVAAEAYFALRHHYGVSKHDALTVTVSNHSMVRLGGNAPISSPSLNAELKGGFQAGNPQWTRH